MCLTLKLLNTSPAQPSTACLTILAVARSPVRVAFLVPVPVAVGVSECHGCPVYIRRYAVHDMAQTESDKVSGKTCAAHQYGFALIPERPDANPRKEVATELELVAGGVCTQSCEPDLRIQMCHEDMVVINRAHPELLTAGRCAWQLCTEHAALFRGIIADRRCVGIGCVAEDGEPKAGMRAGRFLHGRDLLCKACHDAVVNDGVATPSRGQREAAAARARRGLLAGSGEGGDALSGAGGSDAASELYAKVSTAAAAGGGLGKPADSGGSVEPLIGSGLRKVRANPAAPDGCAADDFLDGSSPVLVTVTEGAAGSEFATADDIAKLGGTMTAEKARGKLSPPDAGAVERAAAAAREARAEREMQSRFAAMEADLAARLAAQVEAKRLSDDEREELVRLRLGSRVSLSPSGSRPAQAASASAAAAEHERAVKLALSVGDKVRAVNASGQADKAAKVAELEEELAQLKACTPGLSTPAAGRPAGAVRPSDSPGVAAMMSARKVGQNVMGLVRDFPVTDSWLEKSPLEKLEEAADSVERDDPDRPADAADLARLKAGADAQDAELEKVRTMVEQTGLTLVGQRGIHGAARVLQTYSPKVGYAEILTVLGEKVSDEQETAARAAKAKRDGGDGVRVQERPPPPPPKSPSPPPEDASEEEIESQSEESEPEPEPQYSYERKDGTLVDAEVLKGADDEGKLTIRFDSGSGFVKRRVTESRLVTRAMSKPARKVGGATGEAMAKRSVWAPNVMFASMGKGVWMPGKMDVPPVDAGQSPGGLAMVMVQLAPADRLRTGETTVPIARARIQDLRHEAVGTKIRAEDQAALARLARKEKESSAKRRPASQSSAIRGGSSVAPSQLASVSGLDSESDDGGYASEGRKGTIRGQVLDMVSSDEECTVVRRGPASVISESSIGPSASQLGGAEAWRGREHLGSLPREPTEPQGFFGVSVQDLQAQFEVAKQGLDDMGKAPLETEVITIVKNLKHISSFRQLAAWVLRGAGSSSRVPQFAPSLEPARLPSKMMNEIAMAAVGRRGGAGRGNEELPYPFALVVTEFVAVAFASCAFGFDATSELTRRGGKYYYSGRTLTLSDIVPATEACGISGWRRSEIARGRNLLSQESRAELSRAEVGVGLFDADSMHARQKAFARMFAHVFSVDIGLGEAVAAFKSLSKRERKSVRLYPVPLLCLVWEHLVHVCMLEIRQQLIACVEHAESQRRDTQRPNLWNTMKMTIRECGSDGRPAFVIPDCFRGILKSDGTVNPESHFYDVWQGFLTEAQLSMMAHGVSELTAGPSMHKKGSHVGGGGEDRHGGGGDDDDDCSAASVFERLEAAATKAVSTVAAKAAQDALGAPPPAAAQPPAQKAVRYPYNTFGGGYSPHEGNASQINNMGREFWRQTNAQWHELCGLNKCLFCLASCTFAGCGEARAKCDQAWKDCAGKSAKHGTMPAAMLNAISNNPKYGLLKIAGLRGGGFLNLHTKVQPLDVQARVHAEQAEQAAHAAAPDPGASGAAVGGSAQVNTYEATGGAALEAAAQSLWTEGRGGVTVPQQLAIQRMSDREAPLDFMLHAKRERPAPIPPGAEVVPSKGLGDMFFMTQRTDEERDLRNVVQWLKKAPVLAKALDGEPADVLAYVPERAARELFQHSPDPIGSGMAPDESWALVRETVEADASRSTLPAIAAWARSVASGAERRRRSSCRSTCRSFRES